jgi:general secretion pathway protein G
MLIIKKLNKGFTLVELLVVISIISLLSSVVLAALNSARVKARDVVRMSDMRQLQKAIETYNIDKGHYPFDTSVNGGTYADCWQPNANWITDAGVGYNWSAGYISKQPHDPSGACIWPWGNGSPAPGTAGTYEYWSDGTKYLLAARLENTSSPYRAEVTGAIDPRVNQSYSTYWTAQGGTTAKYVFVLSN